MDEPGMSKEAPGAEGISGSAADGATASILPAGARAGAGGAEDAGIGVGESIGPYRLLRLLGEGGFGQVFLAEQERPVRRRVALKVIKLGMDTRQVIARFEAERQALALMDHPNVAKVFDAGATESGRPYFVMEYVQGEPITAYCDRRRMTLTQRLELFITVCEAVQHSHMKGIIHRDLKPSNILVAEQDGRAVPKVIDFGIAKAVSSRLTERTVFTEQGVMIGTPEYMSPEQAEVGAQDIDTRADVYSLGVVLYELLTGAAPFDSRELRAAAYGRIQQIIREVEPPRPSTRLTSLAGADAAAVAERRRARIEELAKELRGELEWIPLRAMRKDRAERYRSASELADDLRNYLAGRPLVAGPESAAYRVRKFVRRNRGAVVAAGAVAASLVLAVAATSYGMVRERGLRARAEAAEREAAGRLAESVSVQRFLREMLESIDPERALGSEVTVREVLDAAAAKVGEDLKDQPRVEATLRHTLGATYHQLGQFEEAIRHLRRAVELRIEHLGESHPETLESMHSLGATMLPGDRVEEGEQILREVAARREKTLGGAAGPTLETRSLIGFALQLRGQDAEAERVYRETLAAQRKHQGVGAKATLETMASLADVLEDLGRLEEAETVARELVAEAERSLGETSSPALMGMSILGSILEDRGKTDEAITTLERVIGLKTRIYGPEHPQTLVSVNALGLAYERAQRFDQMAAVLGPTAAAAERTLGPEHEFTLTYTANWARAEQLCGRLEAAERLMRATLERRLRLTGADAQATLVLRNNLALLLLDLKKPAEAEPEFRAMIAGLDKILPEGHWMRGASRLNLGECLMDLERFEEAEAEMLAGYEGLKATLGAEHPRATNAAKSIATLYRKWGKEAEAARWGEGARH